MIIMGIDPGLASTGVGIIEESDGNFRRLTSCQVLTSTNLAMPERLERIYALVESHLTRYKPSVVAIESIFFAKNVKSAVMMAHGRGAAILATHRVGVTLLEYSPLEIKQSVVGRGRATKDQVQEMVRLLLKEQDPVVGEHEADALACALCHAFRRKAGMLTRKAAEQTTEDSGDAGRQTQRKELLAEAFARRSGKRRRR